MKKVLLILIVTAALPFMGGVCGWSMDMTVKMIVTSALLIALDSVFDSIIYYMVKPCGQLSFSKAVVNTWRSSLRG